MPVGALPVIAAHDVVQVAQVVLHRLDFGEAVEGPDDEERVSQPAVAVVPVALGVRGLRDAGGHCRDDRAGLLERAELERDGRAHDRLLPLERERETPGPSPPVRGGLLLELARGLLDTSGEGLVGSEDEAHRLLEQEWRLFQHVGDRGVGVEPQRLARVRVADVVGAMGDVRSAGAVVEARTHADPDARGAAGRADPANQGGGPERAPSRLEARGEVGHDDAVPCTVHHPRLQNRGVGTIALLRPHRAEKLDGEESRPGIRVVVDQAAEHRVRVEARQAAPHDARGIVHERAVGAVADDSEVQGRHQGSKSRPKGPRGLESERWNWTSTRCTRQTARPGTTRHGTARHGTRHPVSAGRQARTEVRVDRRRTPLEPDPAVRHLSATLRNRRPRICGTRGARKISHRRERPQWQPASRALRRHGAAGSRPHSRPRRP